MPAGRVWIMRPIQSSDPNLRTIHISRNVVENDMLEMAEHFKNIVNEKNKILKSNDIKLKQYKKLFCSLYGLIKIVDDTHENDTVIEHMRLYLSNEVEELLGIESEEEEEY
tara:strand:+ start:889 stop:1221 length:333 start_codon:yes stop_codon:yes gene_type:complete